MKNEEIKAIEILEKYNQHHIIEHQKKLNETDKEKLINQIKEIDFEEITNLYENTKIKREKKKAKIEPLQTTIAKKLEPEQRSNYISLGEQIIKENKFAVVTMAGGQGTRLRA